MDTLAQCPQCCAALSEGILQGLCARCLSRQAGDIIAARTATTSTPKTQSSTALRYFGDYELLEEIARGGMGVVWKARQVSLNRIVAVKMLLAGKFSSPEFIQRFRTEAEAAANLLHPNIVAIHEVGEHEGQQYFSMDYVEGPNLSQLARDQPLSAKRAAACLKTIAEAVHYAHRRGVIHRDLKPSNVLLDASDQPRVTDFGLAKFVAHGVPALAGQRSGESEVSGSSNVRPAEAGSPNDFTLTGQVLGTPAFMPPEQAGGRKGAVGPASDVYSLGALLYFLLTGRAPFVADTLEETLRQVHELEPVSPRLLNPAVPLDLETICLKCLEKDPRRRYATAEEVTGEMGRFLADEPIRARPVSLAEKLWRWCRRKPALAASLATVFLLLLTVAIVSTTAAVRIERARAGMAKAQRETTTNLWGSYLAQAHGNRLSGRPGRRFDSLDALAKAAAIRPSSELRDEAIAALALSDVRVIRRATNFTPEQIRPAFDANLERYAINTPAGEISVRQTSDDREILRLPAGEQKPKTVARYSPSGRLLGVCYEDGSLKVWDLESQRDVFTGQCAEDSSGMGADFAPDERHIALVNGRREITIHDLATGEQLHSWSVPVPVTRVRYSPDGKALAVAAGGSPLAVVDAASGTTIVYWPKAAAYWFAWHPDGRLLAISGADRQIHLWDVREDKEVRVLLGHSADNYELAFSPTEELLISTAWSGTSIWNYRTGERVLSWSDDLRHLQVAADGRRMVRRPHQRADFELSEMASGSPVSAYGSKTPYGAHDPDNKRSASFSPDGNLLAFARGRVLRVLDARNRRELAAASISPAECIAFDSQTNLWLSGPRGLWRLPARFVRAEGLLELGPPEPVGPVAATYEMVVSLDGRTLVAVCEQRCLVFDTLTGGQVARTSGQQQQGFPALSADGRLLATATMAKSSLRFWDARTGNPRPVPENPDLSGPPCAMAFSPDGQSLATVSSGHLPQEFRCSLWSVATGQARWAVPREQERPIISFSPDGRWVALMDAQRFVRLLSAETGRPAASLEAPMENHIGGFAFSPDSTRLAAWGGTTDELYVWDLPSLRQHLVAIGLDWEMPPLPDTVRAPSPPLQVRIVEDSLERLEWMRAAVASAVPSRDPQAGASLLDLSSYYNMALTSRWFPGYDASYSEMPRGLVRFGGADFDVRGMIQLAGSAPQTRDYPRCVEGIHMGRSCQRLHFLHATRGGLPEGTRIGSYQIHYGDGRHGEWPLLYGRNILAHWRHPDDPETPPNLVEAWSGRNEAAAAQGQPLRVFKVTWKNPRPGVPIESIDFVSDLTKCEPFLIAITAEP